MPFLRFSRDRRGYEHFYLMQPSSARRGRGRPRILYWFRTPPQVKVGREPFAEHVRRGLEAQNPGVAFDWDTLVATPIPPPAADHWRERRRTTRAAKQAAEAESAAAGDVDADVPVAGGPEPVAPSAPEGSQPAPRTQELQTPTDPGRRRRRRRGGRRAPPPGNGAASPADKPEGGPGE